MKVEVQYICNLLIKKKQLTYPLNSNMASGPNSIPFILPNQTLHYFF